MRKCLITLLVLILILACPSASAQTYHAVRAVASPCYVYNGPGTEHKITGTLSTGSCFNWAGSVEYDSRGIAWFSVYYSGGLGWVSALHGDLVTLSDGSSPETDRSDAPEEGTYVRANASLNVRTGPGLKYPAVGVLLAGESAGFTGFRETDSRGVDWYQILYNGVTGWVSSAYAAVH